MPTISASTQKWGPVVDAELERLQVPLPRELVLALIDVESRGKTGLVNPKSGASGLTQVMPGTLDWYNQKHSQSPVSLAELRSSAPSAGVSQIRVGLWILAHYWRSAFDYLSGRLAHVPVDELAHIADLFYVAGPGATRKRLDKLSTPTWTAVQASFPAWNALPHPRNVFARVPGLQWPVDQISAWLDQPQSIFKTPTPKQGFALAALGILLAWWYMKRRERS